MSINRTLFLSDLLAHGNGNISRAVTVTAHAAKLLAHQAGCTTVDDFLEFRRDRVKTVKDALRHQPTRFGGVALEPIKFVRRAFLFRAGNVFHRFGRTVSIARTACDTAAAGLIRTFGIKPFFDALKPEIFLGFVLHNFRRCEICNSFEN